MGIRHGHFLLPLLLAVGLASDGSGGPQTPGAAASAPPEWVNDLTPIGPADWNYERAAHLLERAGFGGTPAEIGKLAAMPPAQAVDYLVDYESIDDSRLPTFGPSGIYTHGYRLAPLQQLLPGLKTRGQALGVATNKDGDLPDQPVVNEFYALLISERWEMRRVGWWWAERMLLTPRPLEEKLTLFWHDHFATSQEKVDHYDLMLGQNSTLRRYANGNFRALLVAIAQDPAMLIWLDNKDNVKGKPNENFAREVMELFTMGEGQGYTEHDIREMARAFTGWTMKPYLTVQDQARFTDDPTLHDDGEKTFLHETGKFNGYDAINIVLKQPQPPRFLSRKLYRYFVREDVAPEVNERLARILLANKYELKPLLKTIFLSRDFYSQPSVGTQIKAPVQLLVSTYRKLGLRSIPGIADFTETTTNLGQLLFFPPNVAGWPSGRAWINPATLLARGNFAEMLLFPDPASYGAPDKVIENEGYRRIPLKYAEYKIQPHIWDARQQQMVPVSLAAYDRYLAGIDSGTAKVMDGAKTEAKKASTAMAAPAMMAAGGSKSKMSQFATNERYNLAVGLYNGFVMGFDRVKPIPRSAATVDVVAMVRDAKATTAAEAVDGLCRRLLSVDLHPERRTAIVRFLTGEIGSEQINYENKDLAAALRRVVHLILSAPEYQLS
jgi:hypothetical protein